MKRDDVTLIIASLLSILFMTLHMTDDIVRGMEPGTLFDLIIVPILAVWLYGTLVLAERRSGYVIILVCSLLGLVVPVIHMKGAGVGGALAKSSGAFFFIGTLLALGVTALFSVMLSVRVLWKHPSGRTDVQPKQGARA
jgi:amino acid transporter